MVDRHKKKGQVFRFSEETRFAVQLLARQIRGSSVLRASSAAERAEAICVARNHFSRNVLATLSEGWDAGTLNCVGCERAFQSFAGSAVCASCS